MEAVALLVVARKHVSTWWSDQHPEIESHPAAHRARRPGRGAGGLATHASLGERVIGPDPDLLDARRAELAIIAGEPRAARELVRETLHRLIEPELDTDGRALVMIGLRAEADEADAARAARDGAREAKAIARAVELEDALRRYLLRVA